MKNLHVLPDNLPVPVDDGACAHLIEMKLPSISLPTTSDCNFLVSGESGIIVIYFFPMIGNPDAPPLIGWNEIPGARGCTPQSCAFRDHYLEIKELGAKVYGVSSQSCDELKAAAQRLHLPFELLSDSSLELASALKLPTFEYNSSRLIKRVSVIVEKGRICKVFYPVFPPNENAGDIVAWLRANRA